MSIGQQIKLTCPPEYAYGKRGFPGVYPLHKSLLSRSLFMYKMLNL